ncbi:retrovirus-related pol polyprotein from transposon TNT 1-94 [Tanacetum coccineum]
MIDYQLADTFTKALPRIAEFRISTPASWNEEYVSGNPETSSGRRRGVKDGPPISYVWLVLCSLSSKYAVSLTSWPEICHKSYTMVDVNVNTPAEQAPAMAPPTRTDDQILPHIRWVPIGKSNCYLDVERSQSNLIYKIAVDILKHTNFFRAFTASSIIPSIYIQQFWDTVRYDNKTESTASTNDQEGSIYTKIPLRDALQITPVNTNNAFSSPPTPDALIKFVNDLGYPRVVRTLSDVVTNDMFQPWKALTTIAITLQSKHKFHPRPGSPLHLPNEEPVLRYLKFSAKGTKREVFGIPIPNDLITYEHRGEQYYNAYLEKVAKHQRYLVGEEVSDPDSPAPKPAKATKPKASKQSKPLAPKAATKKPIPTPAKPQEKKQKLVTETSEAPSPAKRSKAENEPRIGDEEADLQKAVEESLKEVYSARQGPLPPMVIRELILFIVLYISFGICLAGAGCYNYGIRAKLSPVEPKFGEEVLIFYLRVRSLRCLFVKGAYGCILVGFNQLVHSFHALSTLRRSDLRTASVAAKPCQGDSSEVYLITGRIPTVAAAGKRHVNSQPHAHTSYF